MNYPVLHSETPLIKSRNMSEVLNKDVFLKMECYQPAGSFKIRGMGAKCTQLVKNGVKHLFSSSGGNAGYAIASAGKQLGVKVSIVVPEVTKEAICNNIRAEGAIVIRHGKNWNDAHNYAMELSRNDSYGYVHPFDDPVVWNGHTSIIREIEKQMGKPGCIVVSIGGGGLFCGIMEGLSGSDIWSDIPVVTVETVGADSLYQSVKANKLLTLEDITSIAVTLGVKQVAEKAFEWGLTKQVGSARVSDKSAVDACIRFLQDHRVVVEPACGAALSIVYNNNELLADFKSVLVIVCGGAGASMEDLYSWKKQLAE